MWAGPAKPFPAPQGSPPLLRRDGVGKGKGVFSEGPRPDTCLMLQLPPRAKQWSPACACCPSLPPLGLLPLHLRLSPCPSPCPCPCPNSSPTLDHVLPQCQSQPQMSQPQPVLSSPCLPAWSPSLTAVPVHAPLPAATQPLAPAPPHLLGTCEPKAQTLQSTTMSSGPSPRLGAGDPDLKQPQSPGAPRPWAKPSANAPALKRLWAWA